MTEAQLAIELGTTQPTVNRILNGQSDCKIAMYRAIVSMHAAKCTSVDGKPSNSIPPPQGHSLALTG